MLNKKTIPSYFNKTGNPQQQHQHQQQQQQQHQQQQHQAPFNEAINSARFKSSDSSASIVIPIFDSHKENNLTNTSSTTSLSISKNIPTKLNNSVPSNTNVTEQRRYNEMEQKLQRIEADFNASQAERKRIEEMNLKLRKSLEDVYRKMAIQEQRRRRDRLAADCVRIGKLVTQRTGPTSVAEVWEEGYALKDLNRKSAELLIRKEEIEKRRKKLATEKRKRKGVNESNPDGNIDSNENDDIELEIIAEENAIKSHSDDLKKDSEAWQEERRLLDAEKAAHLKEFRRCQSEDYSRFTRDLPCILNIFFIFFYLF
jgi:hypothetical protein